MSFQQNAFQENAFQVGGVQTVVPVPPDIPIGGAGHPVPGPSIWWGEKKRRKFTKTFDWILDRVVSELYGELTQPNIAKSVQKEAAKLVRPYAKDGEKVPQQVNWMALEQDIATVQRLIALWQDEVYNLQLQEDEDIWLLMH